MFKMDSILNLKNLQQEADIWRLKEDMKIETAFEDAIHDELFLLEDKSWWFKHRNKIIHTTIERYPPPIRRLLADVGGGNGFVSAYLNSYGIETILFEPGVQGVLNAKRRGLKNLLCAPLDKTTVMPNCLPAIGLFDVLEHMERESELLQEVQYALSPNGMLYVTVPAHNFLWSDEDDIAEHYRRYTKESLVTILSQNGFNVVFASYFFRMLSPAIFVLRSLPHKLGRKKKAVSEASGFVVPALVGKLADSFFDTEVKKIQKGQAISHGASIIAVARKDT